MGGSHNPSDSTLTDFLQVTWRAKCRVFSAKFVPLTLARLGYSTLAKKHEAPVTNNTERPRPVRNSSALEHREARTPDGDGLYFNALQMVATV